MDRRVQQRILSLGAGLLSVGTRVGFRRPTGRRVLILPPSSPGSLGDEAQLASLVQALGGCPVQAIDSIGYLSTNEYDHVSHIRGVVSMEEYFSHHYFRDRMRALNILPKYSHLIVLGADVLDGAYSQARTVRRLALASVAAKAGLKTSIVNFSLNRHPTPAAIEAWHRVPASVRLCTRDPVSRDRLRRLLAGRQPELGADLAFLLAPNESASLAPLLSWIDDQKDQRHTVVGLNVNPQALPFHHCPDLLIESYLHTMIRLESEHASFALIPHDFRGVINDATVSQKLLEMVPPSLKSRCLMIPTPCSAAEVKAVCGKLDAAIVGRMHCAIACLSQGVPVGAITYQDKFEGLFQHFGIEGTTVTPDTTSLKSQLEALSVSILRRRDEMRPQILAHLPNVKRLARLNVEVAMHGC